MAVIDAARGRVAAWVYAAAATERMRWLLGELMQSAGMTVREMALGISERGDRVDVRAMLSGKRSLELGHLIAALDILAVEPRRFFAQVWSEPAGPSPLLRRLQRKREMEAELGWWEPDRAAQRRAAARAAAVRTPREAADRVRVLTRNLLEASLISMISVARRLRKEGVAIRVTPVLEGRQRLRVFDWIALLDLMELHPLELVRGAWPSKARPAESRRQRADEADGYPGGLLRQVD